MKYSIIIPVFNGEKYIKECLNSVINQTFKDWELVIVDDGSNDDTKSICLYLALGNPKIHYFYKENGGVTLARKKGVEVSTGDYIVFLDADDTLTRDFLSFCEDEMSKDTDIFVVGQHEGYINQEEYIHGLLSNEYSWYLWCKVYRRQLFDESTLYISSMINNGEDLISNIQLAKKALKIQTSSLLKNYYYYRENQNSVTHNRLWSLEYEECFVKEVFKNLDGDQYRQGKFNVLLRAWINLVRHKVRIPRNHYWRILLEGYCKQAKTSSINIKLLLNVHNKKALWFIFNIFHGLNKIGLLPYSKI